MTGTLGSASATGSNATKPASLLLIPGAWMGSWIWQDTVDRLRGHGIEAHTITLSGLGAGAYEQELAEIRLDDHVNDALQAISEIGGPVTVVGHSYSGIVAGMVADRIPEAVVHTVIVAGFYPQDGRSLLDDWGSDADERAAERADIEKAGMVWAPPQGAGLDADPGLDEKQAAWLAQRLQPHPGHTILDPVSMRRPITEKRVTVVANVGDGDPTTTLPSNLAESDLSNWVFRTLPEGHWPMLGYPDQLDRLLVEAATTAAREVG